MEYFPSMEEQQLLVSSFLQIVVGQTTAIATQFLQATRWNLHDAIRLFVHFKDGGGVSSPYMPPPISGNLRLQSGQMVASCNSDLVSRRFVALESKETAPSTANASHDKLSSTPECQGTSNQGFLPLGPKANHAFLCQKRQRSFDTTFLDVQDPSKKQRILDDEPNVDKNGRAFSSGKPIYPILPEEPQATNEVCRIRIRLPGDGHFIQRNFLRADSTKLLWSFCSLHLKDGQTRGFHFTQALPGASKTLTYHSNLSFEEAGLSNWLITLVWD